MNQHLTIRLTLGLTVLAVLGAAFGVSRAIVAGNAASERPAKAPA